MYFRRLQKIIIVALFTCFSTQVIGADDVSLPDDTLPVTSAEDRKANSSIASRSVRAPSEPEILEPRSSGLETSNRETLESVDLKQIDSGKAIAQTLSDIGAGINDIVRLLNNTLNSGLQQELLGSLSEVVKRLNGLTAVQEKYFPLSDGEDDSGAFGDLLNTTVQVSLGTEDPLNSTETEDELTDVDYKVSNTETEDKLSNDEPDEEVDKPDAKSNDAERAPKAPEPEPNAAKTKPAGTTDLALESSQHSNTQEKTGGERALPSNAEELSPYASYNFSNADIQVLVEEVKVLQNILRNFTEASNPKIHSDVQIVEKLLKDFTETGLQTAVHKGAKQLESVFKNFRGNGIVDLSDKVDTLETVVKKSSNSELKSHIQKEIAGLLNVLKSLEDSDTHSLVRELGELQTIVKNSSSAALRNFLEEETKGLDTWKQILHFEPEKQIPQVENERSADLEHRKQEEDPELENGKEEEGSVPEGDSKTPPENEESENLEEEFLDSVMEDLKSILKNRGISTRFGIPAYVKCEKYSKPHLHPSKESRIVLGPAIFRKPDPILTNTHSRIIPIAPLEKPDYFPHSNPTPNPPIESQPTFSEQRAVNHNQAQQPQSPISSTKYSEGNEYFRSIGNDGYDFKYVVKSPGENTQFERYETRKNNAVSGGYSTLLPDGRLQTVEYTADDTGFHPTITYSKPS